MRWTLPVALAVSLLVTACSDTPKSTKPTDTKATDPKEDQRRMEPCHPGCFPAGTLVDTPTGPRAIETIRKNEVVTIIEADGQATSGAVETVFETCNRLYEVRTDSGNLTTTETQPLCLKVGGFKAAGELKAGDVIWRWADGNRTPTTVKEVVIDGREVTVFNLVVGESKVFSANGFLARGKPPVEKTAE
jgi:hypothetical protein